MRHGTRSLRNLGVARGASEKDIKSAYRKLAKELHPDHNKDNPKAAERFSEVTRAYDLLSDKDKRARFDRGEIDVDGNPTGFGGGLAAGRAAALAASSAALAAARPKASTLATCSRACSAGARGRRFWRLAAAAAALASARRQGRQHAPIASRSTCPMPRWAMRSASRWPMARPSM
jgi:curved DNA-binding protein CbpA